MLPLMLMIYFKELIFRFETEMESGKFRRDVFAAGSVSSGGSSGVVSLLSGQEEMFAFLRAVSRLVEMQTSLYLDGVRHFHPFFENHSEHLPNCEASHLCDASSSICWKPNKLF